MASHFNWQKHTCVSIVKFKVPLIPAKGSLLTFNYCFENRKVRKEARLGILKLSVVWAFENTLLIHI